ncbi:hypothetical protein P3X46_000286 [Hevea brasiliensis]|uniref:Uncharacterized protein n=1 Tax=Hevea brasiliensis TaxID=3981 RepID=A0ABQ9NB67_HEVBR|nr:uncharacterized protein LOC110656003 [Hevea brasiliensis]KAJ9188937.1 hypothetical protein P3X46_000286 [Hevea brasiliensis]
MANITHDTGITALPATYVNLHKWLESDTEFERSGSYKGCRPEGVHGHPRVVDSRSCRQLYLRSYTFSRKESVPEKAKKCIGKVKERIKNKRSSRQRSSSSSPSSSKASNNSEKIGFGKRDSFRRVPCAALFSMFKRLLSCTTKVDVVEHGDQ